MADDGGSFGGEDFSFGTPADEVEEEPAFESQEEDTTDTTPVETGGDLGPTGDPEEQTATSGRGDDDDTPSPAERTRDRGDQPTQTGEPPSGDDTPTPVEQERERGDLPRQTGPTGPAAEEGVEQTGVTMPEPPQDTATFEGGVSQADIRQALEEGKTITNIEDKPAVASQLERMGATDIRQANIPEGVDVDISAEGFQTRTGERELAQQFESEVVSAREGVTTEDVAIVGSPEEGFEAVFTEEAQREQRAERVKALGETLEGAPEELQRGFASEEEILRGVEPSDVQQEQPDPFEERISQPNRPPESVIESGIEESFDDPQGVVESVLGRDVDISGPTVTVAPQEERARTLVEETQAGVTAGDIPGLVATAQPFRFEAGPSGELNTEVTDRLTRGEGLFGEQREQELLASAQEKQERYSFEEQAETGLQEVGAGPTVTEFGGGVGMLSGELAALGPTGLFAADLGAEVATNLSGTVQEFGPGPVAGAITETTGRAAQGVIEQAEANPASFAGKATGEILLGTAAGAAGRRGLSATRGRLATRGQDFQGEIPIQSLERPDVTSGQSRLTRFSEEAVPGGKRSMPAEDFPVATASRDPAQELRNLAGEFSDPELEEALDVQEGEFTLFSARSGLKGEDFVPRSGRPYDPDAAFFSGSVSTNFLDVAPSPGLSGGIPRPRLPQPVEASRSLFRAARGEDTPTIIATAGPIRELPEGVADQATETRFLRQRSETGIFFTRRPEAQSGEAEALVSARGVDKDVDWRTTTESEATEFVRYGDPFETQFQGERVPIQLFRPATGPDVDIGDAETFTQSELADLATSRSIPGGRRGTPIAPTTVPSAPTARFGSQSSFFESRVSDVGESSTMPATGGTSLSTFGTATAEPTPPASNLTPVTTTTAPSTTPSTTPTAETTVSESFGFESTGPTISETFATVTETAPSTTVSTTPTAEPSTGPTSTFGGPTSPPTSGPSTPTGPPTGPPSMPPSQPPSIPPSLPPGPPSTPPSIPPGPPTTPPPSPPTPPTIPGTGGPSRPRIDDDDTDRDEEPRMFAAPVDQPFTNPILGAGEALFGQFSGITQEANEETERLQNIFGGQL